MLFLPEIQGLQRKTGTCQKCDQYINKAEAEKTDEQRYNEEQDAIDRQTKKKLQERADAEKWSICQARETQSISSMR